MALTHRSPRKLGKMATSKKKPAALPEISNPRPVRPRDNIIKRYWSHVAAAGHPDDDPRSHPEVCWRWTGTHSTNPPDNPYGLFALSGTQQPAHRVMLALIHNIRVEGTRVLHRCAFNDCVNPNHLSHRANKSLHVSWFDQKNIRRAYRDGESIQFIAREYKLSRRQVMAILSRRIIKPAPSPAIIAETRQDAFLSRAEAAAAVGVTLSTWRAYEYGQRSMPLPRWQAFREACGLPRNTPQELQAAIRRTASQEHMISEEEEEYMDDPV